MTISSWEDLISAVDAGGGFHTLTMGELRDAYGVGKLGIHVVKGISEKLAGLGFAHYPRELPQYQHERIRVFRMGVPVAKIIAAVLNVDEASDQILRSVKGSEAEDTLRKIRELVCD